MQDLATWTIALGLFLISIIETPGVMVNWHVVPKQVLMLILGTVCLGQLLWPWEESSLAIGFPQIAAIGWALWCLASCSWSINPYFSFRTAIMQAMFAVMFILISSRSVDLTIICLSGGLGLILNCWFSIYQHLNGDPWVPGKVSRCGFATFGNRNWYASYCAGAIAFPLWLGFNHHPSWFFLVGLTILSLVLARSKASALSLTLGLAAIPVLFSKRIRSRLNTLRYRLYYWRAGLYLLKERPLIGFGFRQFRREIYRANSAINLATGGKFLNSKTYQNPKPRETHNDFLGIAIDCGLIGLGLLLCVVISVLAFSTNWLLGYGVVGVLLNAIVFYPLRTPGAGVVFWVLLGLICAPSDQVTFNIPYELSVILILVTCIPILIVTYNHLMAAYYTNQGFKTADGKWMGKALIKDPNSSTILMAVAGSIAHQDLIAAAHCYHQIIEHYDGDTIPWAIWSDYGQCRLGLGSVIEARKCFEQALSLWPHYRPAIQGIFQCDQILRQGKLQLNFSEQKEP